MSKRRNKKLLMRGVMSQNRVEQHLNGQVQESPPAMPTQEERVQAVVRGINELMERYACKFIVVEKKIDGVAQPPEVVVTPR